ncbi:hypothetical protein CEXT_210691 [Caerostris extrusa]|uniref:Uncharacterized protein n=1 Tax=Caerostris extrusa TaxID=172846 RepID=A0AAV4XIR9_CAEEX|nr:hypothetical protein CEXT_210691 [Caerostris extrusa]
MSGGAPGDFLHVKVLTCSFRDVSLCHWVEEREQYGLATLAGYISLDCLQMSAGVSTSLGEPVFDSVRVGFSFLSKSEMRKAVVRCTN